MCKIPLDPEGRGWAPIRQSNFSTGPKTASSRLPAMRDFEKRKTRGTRIAQLVGEAKANDEAFWGHSIWKDDEKEGADDFSSTSTESDVEASDIDITESEGEQQAVGKDTEAESRPQAYVDPSKSRKKRTLASMTKAMEARPVQPAVKRPRKEPMDRRMQYKAVVRASTKQKLATSVEQRQKETKTRRPVVKRMPSSRLSFSQQQLLKEAAHVEIQNTLSLENLLRLEEEKKRQTLKKRQVTDTVRYVSKLKGKTTISFSAGIPPILLGHSAPPQKKSRMRCAITGEPAKYLDPVTRMPFATVAAFRELRRRAGGRG